MWHDRNSQCGDALVLQSGSHGMLGKFMQGFSNEQGMAERGHVEIV